MPSSEVCELMPHLIPNNLNKIMDSLTHLYEDDVQGVNNEPKPK